MIPKEGEQKEGSQLPSSKTKLLLFCLKHLQWPLNCVVCYKNNCSKICTPPSPSVWSQVQHGGTGTLNRRKTRCWHIIKTLMQIKQPKSWRRLWQQQGKSRLSNDF